MIELRFPAIASSLPAALPVTEAGPRVLQVVISLTPGGAERLVIDMTKQLNPTIPTAVCCLDEPGEWASELSRIGIEVFSLGRQPGFRPSIGWRLADVADRFRATVLHCHQYSPFVYGCLAALRRPGLRIVFTEHGRFSDTPPSRKRRLANRMLGHCPAHVAAVSNELRAHLATGGFRPNRVQLVYNGIDPGLAPRPRDRERARRALTIAPDAFALGTVGRLDPVKDFPTLLDAFACLRPDVPEATLFIIGDGPERLALETRAAALRLGTSVRFLGMRRDARALLPGLDAYVNSSISEGVSLTILEAMAAALPVVATSVGGTPEVVIDGRTGILVPSRQAQALRAALTSLAASEERRRTLGDAARSRVVATFSFGRMLDQYIAVYRGQERA